jgi:hypothetical protein
MKKPLLFVLICLAFIGSAIAVSYTPDGFGGYRGSDGTRWTPDGFGGLRGSNGVYCKQDYYGNINCSGGNQNNQNNNGWNDITNASGGIGASFGQALGELFSSFSQPKKNTQTLKKNNTGLSTPPKEGYDYFPGKSFYKQDDFPGNRIYEQGTIWTWKGKNGNDSDGMSCSYIDKNVFSCNNGITYIANPNEPYYPLIGTDGTRYQTNWGYGGNADYYCVASNFGSKCCGNLASLSCNY